MRLTLTLFVLSVASACAADIDCAKVAPGDCGFGDYILNVKGGVITNLSETNPDWSGTLTATAYLANGIYTYLYKISLDAKSTAQVYRITLAYLNPASTNTFDSTLNYGVLTDVAWTSKGVDDCADTNGIGCPVTANKTGFDFFSPSLNVSPANLLTDGTQNLIFTFYAQSKSGPIADQSTSRLGVSGINGGNANLDVDTTIVPTVPEPGTLILLAPILLAMSRLRFRPPESLSAFATLRDAFRSPILVLWGFPKFHIERALEQFESSAPRIKHNA